ncbi:MAG: PQQ-like beta-propeller repeat protein [Pirellulales bacterium]|nr:PQQ-like beta-propeller repeat protein [Pirellulales bacterium]
MKPNFSLLPLLAACLVTITSQAENWPGWRGPRGDGSSNSTTPPLKWNAETGEGILWKTEIPGIGHASPIIWKDRAFIVTCDLDAEVRQLIALDANKGTILWKQDVIKAKLEKKHALNSFASGTPATDGELIYVTFFEAGDSEVIAPNVGSERKIFPGKMVVAAYDYQGNQQWLVKPGEFISAHGYSSCPVLYKDLVIVNGDHDGDSYILALNKFTGKTMWKTKRSYGIRSYCTPLIREIDGRMQMVFSGSKHIISLNPDSGEVHWVVEGPTEQFVASMVYDGELFYMCAGFPTYHVMGIDPRGKGDVTESHVRWHSKEVRCYVPSPVVIGEYLIVADDRGTANCYSTKDGTRQWLDRLGNHFSASLLKANGLAYLFADDGMTKIIKPGKELEIVAENPLNEYIYASPAIANNRLYIRGEKHLYCIGK